MPNLYHRNTKFIPPHYQTHSNNMAFNRQEVINKLMRLKTTEINKNTGVEETHNQLEWMLIYHHSLKVKKPIYGKRI